MHRAHYNCTQRIIRGVPLEDIPHVFLGNSTDNTLRTWMCFPALYFRGCSWVPLDSTIQCLYDKVLRPALQEHCATDDNEMLLMAIPDQYERIYQFNQDSFESVCDRQLSFKNADVQRIGEAILAKAAEVPMFKGAYFVHYRVTPPNSHNIYDQGDRLMGWLELTRFLSDNRPEALKKWTIEVSARYSHPGKMILWNGRGAESWLKNTLEDVDEATINRLVSSSRRFGPRGNFLMAPAQFTVDLNQHGKDYGVQMARFTSSSTVTTPRHGEWRVYKAQELFSTLR